MITNVGKKLWFKLKENQNTFLSYFFVGLGSFFILIGIFWEILLIKANETDKISRVIKINTISTSQNLLYQKILSSKTTDNYPPSDFFPENLYPEFREGFNISVDAYAVMDRDKRQLLFGKNLTKRLPIASITKIMTAIVTLENSPLEAIFTVSPKAAGIGEASMGLTIGEKLTRDELLYGAILPSGNDAAETLAEGVGIYNLAKNNLDVDREKGREWFINEMNRKAQSIGMMDTYFFNPTGLDEDTPEKTTFSTVLDLLALSNYALRNEVFAKIAETKNYLIPYKENYHKAFPLYNILQLDGAFKGIKGIKPGSSIYAGETLASYIERDGRRIIVIILGSNYTKDDVLKIYKKIFSR